MMGYAHEPGGSGAGQDRRHLRTGDLARRAPDGLYEVIGRSSRFVKLYGLRIDLQRVEAALSAGRRDSLLHRRRRAARGRRGGPRRACVQALRCRPPASRAAVRVVTVDELPLLPSGKPDYQAVRGIARRTDDLPQSRRRPSRVVRRRPADRSAHDRPRPELRRPRRQLAVLRGDVGSARTRARPTTGRLAAAVAGRAWNNHRRPARRRGRGWAATLETSVALRAAAIVLVVGSHATLYEMWGGAHLLLGIAGYNFGRFCLTPVPRGDRVRHLRKTIAWIVVPSVIWIALALLITDDYHRTNLLLVEKFFGPDDSMTAGRLWFVEVLVWILIALTFVCWLPAADRLERRRPFAFAAAFLALGLALRYDLFGLNFGRDAWFTILAFWFFAVGLGGGQVVDGVAAARGDAGVGRQPARLLRQHPSRSVGARRVPAADLAARDPLPGLVHGRRGDGRGSVAVHLSDALSGVSVVRRSSAAGCRRGHRRRRVAHPGGQRDAHADPRADWRAATAATVPALR